MFQPALHIHFAQSVTSMTQKETIHVFSGNRKLREYKRGFFRFFFLLNLAPSLSLLFSFASCSLFSTELCQILNLSQLLAGSHSSKLASCPTIPSTPNKTYSLYCTDSVI